jgi:hypothetical protein
MSTYRLDKLFSPRSVAVIGDLALISQSGAIKRISVSKQKPSLVSTCK